MLDIRFQMKKNKNNPNKKETIDTRVSETTNKTKVMRTKAKTRKMKTKGKKATMKQMPSLERKTINVDVRNKEMAPIVEFDVVLSQHSEERSIKRSISEQAIKIALIYGDTFYKQGLVYYVMGEKNVPELVHPQVRKKCKNLVVIASGDDHTVITMYRSKNPFRHIKSKPKRLSRYGSRA